VFLLLLDMTTSSTLALHEFFDAGFRKSEERTTWEEPLTVLRCEMGMVGSEERSLRVVAEIYILGQAS